MNNSKIVAAYVRGTAVADINATIEEITAALAEANETLRSEDQPVNHFPDADEYWIDCNATRVDQLLGGMTATNNENRSIPQKYIEELTNITALVGGSNEA